MSILRKALPILLLLLATPAAATEGAPATRAFRALARAEVRSGPDAADAVVGSVEPGDLLMVDDRREGWLHVAGLGWLREADAAPYPSAPLEQLRGATVPEEPDWDRAAVMREVREAEALYDDLVNFAPARTMLLPAWETLPHEELKPHPEIVGDRVRAMLSLSEPADQGSGDGIGPPILLGNVQSVLLKVVPPELLI